MTDIDYMIATMQAAKEGKAIQSRHRHRPDTDECWVDAPEPSWNWATFDYRAKSEPRRIWLNQCTSGALSNLNWLSQSEAEHAALTSSVKQIEFVEVVE